MKPSEAIEQVMVAAYRKNANDRVGDPTIHVSNLINFCPRTYWLCVKNDRSYHAHKYFGIQTKYDFDVGHAIQAIQIRRLASQGAVFSRWRCKDCGRFELGFFDRNRKCPKCNGTTWRHADIRLELPIPPGITVVGHIDYVFCLPKTSKSYYGYVTDAKSISADYFDALQTPSIEYRRQVQLYMWLMAHKDKVLPGHRRNGDIVSVSQKTALISYGVKGSRKMPYKFFDVEQDAKFIKATDASLQVLSKSLATDTAPTKICKSPHNLMAKQCSARDICFDQVLPGMGK